MLMMHGRGGCTVRTLVGVHIDNQFSSFLPLQGKINLSRERLRVSVSQNCIQILHIPFFFEVSTPGRYFETGTAA